MLQEIYQLVQQIEQAKKADGGGENVTVQVDKAEVVERLRGLYEAKARRLPDDRAAMFDHLFLNLSDGIDAATKRKLSTTLAMYPRAPEGIVGKLAQDEDASVAEPLLASALRIEERLLEAVALNRGQKHLQALARRGSIGERITTPIARRGDDETVLVLSTNRTARFSDEGFDLLSERARTNAILRSVVCARPDMPRAQFDMLLALDGTLVCEEFDAEYGDAALPGDKFLSIVSAAMHDGRPTRFSRAMMAASFDYVAMRALRRSVTQADLERWLRRRQFEDAIAGLAILSAIPPEFVQRLIVADSLYPAAMLVKAIGFEWATLKPFWQVRSEAGVGQEAPNEVYEVFDAIDTLTARRLMRHVALREKIIAFPEVEIPEDGWPNGASPAAEPVGRRVA
ncbi:MAG: DUF2336 domain-containing protein [Salinarimonas sp.]